MASQDAIATEPCPDPSATRATPARVPELRKHWKRAAIGTRRILELVSDFCYPAACAVCDATLPPAASATPLCDACLASLHALETAPACGWCAMPVAQPGDPCPRCTGKGVYPFDRIVRLGVFEDPIKDLVHRAKYHGRWALAELLADRLLEQERVKGLLSEPPVDRRRIVPVPLYGWRHMVRGYNQAEVIARRLAKHSGVRLARPAIRLRNTETQTHLHSHERRLENLRDAFGLIDPKSVAGRDVVLVDDVMTTGATLGALARALRAAKPASVCAIVVAVADPRRRGFERIGSTT